MISKSRLWKTLTHPISNISIAILFFRILAFVFLLLSLFFISVDTRTDNVTGAEIKFHHIYAYRGHLFDFFGDKMISYLLISGSAAKLGLTVEQDTQYSSIDSFADKANVSASLLLHCHNINFHFLCFTK
ncbi:hypothetical protein VNO78_14734 [Psophocarpus tetragonolobus]|uniref:Uncharacterized protein n=1 Tax=Psophocarpus tetragonolobus TaxID=3891 RepID=A0AAN9XIJ1_PSOTE